MLMMRKEGEEESISVLRCLEWRAVPCEAKGASKDSLPERPSERIECLVLFRFALNAYEVGVSGALRVRE